MPRNNEKPSEWGALLWALLGCFVIALLMAMTIIAFSGCSSTVTPLPIETKEASYSGNAKNSGVWNYDRKLGGTVDQHWVDRYDELIGTWSKHFSPQLLPQAGVTGPFADLPVAANQPAPPLFLYRVDKEHFADKALMEQWVGMGRIP